MCLGIHAPESNVEAGELNLDGYAEVARQVVSQFPNVSRVAITLRESISASHNNWGALLYDRGTQAVHFAPTDSAGRYEPYEIHNIVDRVGAGDSFAGGLIFALNTPGLDARRNGPAICGGRQLPEAQHQGRFQLRDPPGDRGIDERRRLGPRAAVMAKRKKKTTELDYWLAAATLPVFVIDSHRTLRAFNAGCEQLTGWAAAELLGKPAITEASAETGGAAALAASLCPPPEVFSGQELSVPAYVFHQQGHALPRLVAFLSAARREGAYDGRSGGCDAVTGRHGRRCFSGPPAARRTGRLADDVAGAVRPQYAGRTERGDAAGHGASGTGSKEPGLRAVDGRSWAPAKSMWPESFMSAERGKANSFVPLDCRRTGADELSRVWNRIVESYRFPRRAGLKRRPSGRDNVAASAP